jgi:hypothetical protein
MLLQIDGRLAKRVAAEFLIAVRSEGHLVTSATRGAG